MSNRLINITEAAEQDLAEIVDYIANDNPVAALNVAEKSNRAYCSLRTSH